MEIGQDYINKLQELSNEVFKNPTLSPAARILIQNLLMTTQVLFAEVQCLKSENIELKARVQELELLIR